MSGLPYLEDPKAGEFLARARALGLRALAQVEGVRIGDQRSPRRGFSVEFAQHREYVPGDDPRHLDWRAYARTERLTIKEYRQETNYTLQIILDQTPSMAYPGKAASLDGIATKAYQARLMALVAGVVAQGQGDQTALWISNGDPTRADDCLVPASAKSGAGRLLAAKLAEIRPSGGPETTDQKSDFARVLAKVVGRQLPRSLFLIISDFLEPFDPINGMMRQIRARGHDLLVLHTLHTDEISLPFNGDFRFEDLESSAAVNTRPHQIRQRYTAIVAEWLERLQAEIRGIGADYALVHADREPQASVLALLAERLAKRKAAGGA